MPSPVDISRDWRSSALKKWPPSHAPAAVVAGRIQGLLEDRVNVDLPGGRLVIQWAGREDDPVFMTGPATSVFTGTIEL